MENENIDSGGGGGQRHNKMCDWKTAISALFALMGFVMFVVFFALKNYEAGIWGFSSFLMASMSFYLNYLNLKQKLVERFDPRDLSDMQGLAFFFTAAGFSGTLWYIFQYFYHHIPVFPIEHSVAIDVVCSFMTFKNGLMLIYLTSLYKNRVSMTALLP